MKSKQAQKVQNLFLSSSCMAMTAGKRGMRVLAMAILAPVAATIIKSAISWGREFDADANGARICGYPLSLASALASWKLELVP